MAKDTGVLLSTSSFKRVSRVVRKIEGMRQMIPPQYRRPVPGDGGISRWYKATANWYNVAGNGSYITANPSDDKDGTTIDTDSEVTIYLQRNGSLQDPNIVSGAIVSAHSTVDGLLVCDGDYLDGVIGVSVEVWAGGVDLATYRAGWVVWTEHAGKFLVNWKSGDADYGCVCNCGGYQWHGLTENNHTVHTNPDHCHSYGQYDCVEEGAPWSGFAWRTTAVGQGSGTTPYTGAAAWAGGVCLSHDGPYNSTCDTDNRPPWGPIILIIRDNNASTPP